MGGPVRKPPYPGHVDLSMTRHVLQALAGTPNARALKYLERCQNGDGGVMFSTVVLDANKAGVGQSYGTATAGGLLSLLGLSTQPDEPKAAAAPASPAEPHRPHDVPGFEASSA